MTGMGQNTNREFMGCDIQSQSFSRGYGSILPTSLAYIVPSTRGCSLWRPDAVMSTTKRGRYSVLQIFKGRLGRTGHRATYGALPATGPYLRMSRFQGGQAVSASLGTVTRLPVHPALPVLLTKNGPLGALDSVARLNKEAAPSYLLKVPTGMLTLEPFSEDQGRSAVHPAKGIPPISFLAPCGFTHPLTRTHVRLLGPCFKTGRMGCPQADSRSAQVPKHAVTARAANHDQRDGISTGISKARALAAATIRTVPRPESIGGPAYAVPHSTRTHRRPSFYLALYEIYRPIGVAFPNKPTRKQRLVVRQGPGMTGLSPSPAPPSRGLGPGPSLRTLLQTTIWTAKPPDFQAGLFPVRSPLLRESLYGYIKNHKKTIKNGQARTRERKSEQKPEVKVNLGQASVKEKVNQGASLNQGSKRAIQELVNKMAGIDQSNQRISLAHSQAQATCDEEKAQRGMGFALNALSKQTQLSLKRIATLAIRVSSLVIQRWTRRNQ
ncbi:hypothetical protein Tco_1165276 [Tanacetum coccineum]